MINSPQVSESGSTLPASASATGTAYTIETRRLVIRCWQPIDAPLLQAAVVESIDHLLPWMPWAETEPMDLEARVSLLRGFRAKFDLGEDFIYGIFNRDQTEVLGGTGLHTRTRTTSREIGYWIRVGHTRVGYATEVASALTRVAFEVAEARRLEIRCGPANSASARIPQKLGFTREALLRMDAVGPRGSTRDTEVWALLPDEFAGSISAKADIRAFDALNRQLI